jgi:fatty acid desaturase
VVAAVAEAVVLVVAVLVLSVLVAMLVAVLVAMLVTVLVAVVVAVLAPPQPEDASADAGSQHRLSEGRCRPSRASFWLSFGPAEHQSRPLAPPAWCRGLSDTEHGGDQ